MVWPSLVRHHGPILIQLLKRDHWLWLLHVSEVTSVVIAAAAVVFAGIATILINKNCANPFKK